MKLYAADDLRGMVSIERNRTISPGAEVLLNVLVDREPGPHRGVLAHIFTSGRVRVHVQRDDRTFRVITDPCHVYALSTPTEFS